MEGWEERLFQEKCDLDIKIVKLRRFIGDIYINDKIIKQELDRMKAQLSAMQEYSDALQSRINAIIGIR